MYGVALVLKGGEAVCFRHCTGMITSAYFVVSHLDQGNDIGR